MMYHACWVLEMCGRCGPSVVTLLEIGGAAIVIGEQRPASVNAYPGAPIIVAAARLYSGIEY